MHPMISQRFCLFILFILGGCNAIFAPDGDVTSPDPQTDLAVSIRSESTTVFEQARVILQANPSGGAPPYRFRWDVNAAPIEVGLNEPLAARVRTSTLNVPGRYVFRLIVTDDTGATESEFIVINVVPLLDITVPDFAIIGEPIEFIANLDPAAANATLTWEITNGAGSFTDPDAASTTFTAGEAATIGFRVTATLPGDSAADISATREGEIVAVNDLTPRVRFETSMGDFTIELNGQDAPAHMVNFLRYVDSGFYEGLVIHRVACSQNSETEECEPFVIQTGGYEREDDELGEREATFEPIESEADSQLSNTQYTVALALKSGDADSGAAQFFINMKDNSFLDDQDFTAFANVVEGTDVLDAIADVAVEENALLGGEISLPLEDIVIERAARTE